VADPSRSLGRNDPCHCGSGKKYKQCCLAKDEAADREARAKAAAATEGAPSEPAKAPLPPPRHATRQPWKRGSQNTKGFGKLTIPRRIGGS
jgi:SEC-C motif